MNSPMDVLHNAIAQYICSSNDAVKFKMIKSPKDLASDEGFFQPDMSHQIFGEKEQIFGYKNLRINLYYAATTLQLYANIEFAKKINPKFAEGVEADELWPQLKDILPESYCESINEFSIKLEKQANFTPHGELISTYTTHRAQKRIFNIYKADMSCPGFKQFHQRMESFILWFIDAASYIDPDDEKWDFFTIFEKHTEGGRSSYFFVGFSTCYRFYAYPDKCRPRISQVMILPPYQKQGHCSQLLKTIYQQYVPNPKVTDITAEDPSDNFQRVRDFVDATNCATLDVFAPSKLQEKFSKEMAKEARNNFKLNKRQSRRIYEILRLRHTNKNDEDQFTKYRLMVKERLNIPLKNTSKQGRLLQAKLMPSLEERHIFLDKEFHQHLVEYEKVVARLDAS